MKYSATTNGFYPSDIAYAALPDDAVDVDAVTHAALMADQATGKTIAADASGNPVSVDAAQPTAAEMRAGMSLSFAQLLIGLVTEGWITEAEGDAWLAGTLPAPVLALIATLPSGQQFAAKARAIRPSEVVRLDPLVGLLAAAQGKTDTDMDTFFTAYAQV